MADERRLMSEQALSLHEQNMVGMGSAGRRAADDAEHINLTTKLAHNEGVLNQRQSIGAGLAPDFRPNKTPSGPELRTG